MVSGLPRKTTITSEEIRECLKEPLGQIVNLIMHTLEKVEPELSADLVDNGVTLAGGGALLRGIDSIVNQSTGLDVTITAEPLFCVARGTSVYLEHIEEWKDTLESDRDSY